jgi:hypothetical protein
VRELHDNEIVSSLAAMPAEVEKLS